MIEFLEGKLVEKNPAYIILNVNGVGYKVNISLNSFEKLPSDEYCKMLIHYQVSVDVRSGNSNHSLYGFTDSNERTIFKHLIQISGISSTTAMLVLSSLTPSELSNAVLYENVDTIKAVKGIGPKMAQKVIAELKGKLGVDEIMEVNSSSPNNTLKNEALSALGALGFDKGKSLKVLNEIFQNETDIKTVEQIIKLALKYL